jgi:hypothetical protein
MMALSLGDQWEQLTGLQMNSTQTVPREVDVGGWGVLGQPVR